MGTTLLARPAIPEDLLPDSGGLLALLALGFLASGGSGSWNSVLTYVLKVKDIKDDLATVAARKAKIADEIAAAQPDAVRRAEAMAKLDGAR